MSCGDDLGTRPNVEINSRSSGVVEMMSSRDIVWEYCSVFITMKIHEFDVFKPLVAQNC